jgi:hypothetical protein
MRWPWRHRGRRRHGDVLIHGDIAVSGAAWGDTFLPQPRLLPASPAAPDLPASTVRLGFADGTHWELPSDTEHFDNLVALAARLTRTETRQRGFRRRS